MSLKDQLSADLKESMRNREAVRRTVIRNIMTTVSEAEQRKRMDLIDEAMKKHGVQRPASASDEDAMAAYDAALNEAIEKEDVEARSQLDDPEVLAIVQKLVKQRQDSIEEAKKAGREDIAEGELEEMDVLTGYLPRQLSREEIEDAARAVIEETGASSVRDMGKVMGPLMEQLKGRADGKLISQVVREQLSS